MRRLETGWVPVPERPAHWRSLDQVGGVYLTGTMTDDEQAELRAMRVPGFWSTTCEWPSNGYIPSGSPGARTTWPLCGGDDCDGTYVSNRAAVTLHRLLVCTSHLVTARQFGWMVHSPYPPESDPTKESHVSAYDDYRERVALTDQALTSAGDPTMRSPEAAAAIAQAQATLALAAAILAAGEPEITNLATHLQRTGPPDMPRRWPPCGY